MSLLLFIVICAAVGVVAYAAGTQSGRGMASRPAQVAPSPAPDLAKFAHKIAHDIKSPLSALKILLSSPGLKEDERKMLRMSMDRLAELASSIVEDYGAKAAPQDGDDAPVSTNDRDIQVRPLAAVLHSVAVDAGADAPRFDITAENLKIMCFMQEPELRKMLSALLKGAKSVSLAREGESAVLRFERPGAAVDEATLQALNARKFDGRAELAHAWETVDILGGRLSFARGAGGALEVTVSIPAEPVPAWLCTSLRLPRGGEVFALDDDRAFHEVWKARLPGAKLRSFYKYEEFKHTIEAAPSADRLYLIDQELEGEALSGLEIIARHNLAAQAVLVSGIAYNSKFIKKLESGKVRFLPKDFASAVEITGA